MKRGLKGQTNAAGEGVLKYSRWKEDWKSRCSLQRGGKQRESRWKEDWKTTSILTATLNYLSLDEKRIESLEHLVFPVLQRPSSMKRGLKVESALFVWWGDTPILDEKRIESLPLIDKCPSPIIYPRWKEDWKSEERLCKFFKRISLLDEKRIESLLNFLPKLSTNLLLDEKRIERSLSLQASFCRWF